MHLAGHMWPADREFETPALNDFITDTIQQWKATTFYQPSLNYFWLDEYLAIVTLDQKRNEEYVHLTNMYLMNVNCLYSVTW